MPRLLPVLLATLVATSGSIAVITQTVPPLLFTAPPSSAGLLPLVSTEYPAVIREQLVGLNLLDLFGAGPNETATAAPRVTLNVFGQMFVATLDRIDHSAQGYRSWVGTIEGQPFSHVVITEGNGVASGLVLTNGGAYQLRTVTPGLYRLAEVLATDNHTNDAIVPLTPGLPLAAGDTAGPDDGSIIDVLILYTPRVLTEAGGVAQLQALAAQIESDTNTAFQRSAITTRVRLVGTGEVPLTERPDINDDVGAVTASPAARALREQYGADLVQLLVHSPQGGGAASQMSRISQDFSESAYSVADWRQAAEFTPTHELGHNMGADHAPGDDRNPRGAFSYSYGYKVRSIFRTVMAYDADANLDFCRCPRIPNFSNPNVRIGGLPTGTPLGSNNSLTIENAAYTVANFRPSVPRYRVTFIRTNPDESIAGSINTHGDVAGFTGGFPYGAFFTRGTSVLPIFGGFTGQQVLLNDHGHLALNERRPADLSVWPFVWDGVSRREIGSLGGTLTEALDFNNHGTVVGLSYGGPGTPYRAFVWNGVTIRDLNFGPSSSFSHAAGINDQGHICGIYSVEPSLGAPSLIYSVFWDGISIRELGTGHGGVAGRGYICRDLNNLGHSAGIVDGPHPSGTMQKAYMWDGSSFKNLGDFGGGSAVAHAINDRDEVVGGSLDTASNEGHAFLWRAGLLHDLHRLANWPEAGWTLYDGHDINNVGQIAATAYKTTRGPFRAARLDPPTLGQQLPLPPTDLRSFVDGRTVRLSWNPAPGGPYTYRLEAGSVDGWADLASVSVSDTSVTFPNVPNGRFFVRVRSQIGLTLSYPAPAVEVQVGQMAPQAPRDLRSTVTGTTVSFEWSSPLSGDPPSSYVLEAGTAPGATNVVPIPIASSPYIAVGVPRGTYYVRVRGVNAAGTGPPSNEVEVIVGADSLPGAPTGLTFVRSGGEVMLTWTAPTTGGAVTGYRLEAGSATTLADLAVVPVSTTSLTAVPPPGRYYVRVRGMNEMGIGPASNEVAIVIP